MKVEQITPPFKQFGNSKGLLQAIFEVVRRKNKGTTGKKDEQHKDGKDGVSSEQKIVMDKKGMFPTVVLQETEEGNGESVAG